MHKTVEKFWVPDSHYDKQIAGLNYALREYDERLRFGKNEANGDWCVFLIARGEEPIAVLGFQNEIPTKEAMMHRLEQADTRRHGDWVLRQMEEHNRKLKEELDRPASEAAGEVATAMESFMHAQGRTPYHRSYSKAIESKRTGGQSGH